MQKGAELCNSTKEKASWSVPRGQNQTSELTRRLGGQGIGGHCVSNRAASPHLEKMCPMSTKREGDESRWQVLDEAGSVAADSIGPKVHKPRRASSPPAHRSEAPTGGCVRAKGRTPGSWSADDVEAFRADWRKEGKKRKNEA